MLKLLNLILLLPWYTSTVAAGNLAGYHYEKPSLSVGLIEAPSSLGHSFGPLPTVRPLPPVPALPALPTPRSKGQFIQTQTIYQTHPAISSSVGKIAKQYQPPGLQAPLLAEQSLTSVLQSESTGAAFSSPSADGISLNSNPPNSSPLAAQPLRVPFGKEAVIRFPSGSSADGGIDTHSRQLHQYAVVEIIDNDIEQDTQPFFNSPFFDSYRAHVGASGTGAIPQPLARSFMGSRSSSAFLRQPQPVAQNPAADAVALGSGGLGFIRLANGNVYLGSGSLGYVSGQQHSQEINEARTRSGAPQPDALHFGHGPLGIRFNKLSTRFK